MNPLRQALADYLALRRALGYKLARDEKLLTQFIEHLEALGATRVTTEQCLAWSCLASGGDNWRHRRLSATRKFATYLCTVDPATEVPASDLLPWRPRRATPYLYSEAEIRALIATAGSLRTRLRVATYRTLLGLLVVTGMRVGEAIRLDRDDVNLETGVIMVRFTKFGKTRELPLHPTTVAALRAYLGQRDQHQPPPTTPAVFISTAGTRLRYCVVHHTFQRLVRDAGLSPRSATGRPRIHDLRHTFAVQTLLDAYRNGWDVQERLTLLSTYLGHVNPDGTYWYLSAAPELLGLAADRLGDMRGLGDGHSGTYLARVFHRPADPRTPRQSSDRRRVPRLLAPAACLCGGKDGAAPPSHLDLDDINVGLVAEFLDHLEGQRRNGIRTRNARLAAIHSLFRYAALRHPEHAATIQRVLAIPPKRFDRALVTFLTETEAKALAAAPDMTTWTGRRDRALLILGLQTGLRVSELTGLHCGDVHLGAGAHVSCHGKGRKERITPLTAPTVTVLRTWLAERAGTTDAPLFPTRRGDRLSRDAVERRIAVHAAAAAVNCPSLHDKHVTAHVLRHTAAMRLLEAGVNTTVIALWLGHEQVDTTAIYLHADLTIKDKALARTRPPSVKAGRYRPPDTLLAFLEAL
jgi:integrase/recombinase XerD